MKSFLCYLNMTTNITKTYYWTDKVSSSHSGGIGGTPVAQSDHTEAPGYQKLTNLPQVFS